MRLIVEDAIVQVPDELGVPHRPRSRNRLPDCKVALPYRHREPTRHKEYCPNQHATTGPSAAYKFGQAR